MITGTQAQVVGLGAAAPVAAGAASQDAHGSHATGESANPHEVRNPDIAQFWLEQIKAQILAKYPTVEAAMADGYASTNPTWDGPQHYTLGGATYATGADGGTDDMSRPFSIIVDKGEIVGVMLRANHGPVDLGAGEWHGHSDDPSGSQVMHVWFDRPLDEAFGGHLPGFMPGEEPIIKPSPKPTPPPGPVPPAPLPDPVPLPEPAPFPFPGPFPLDHCCCTPPSSPVQVGRKGTDLLKPQPQPTPQPHNH